ncbi:MAG: DUF805 domain-containing protein [Akkermansia sp.]|nr:DUF805 domain-containing protein [Akkermansia sp.]
MNTQPPATTDLLCPRCKGVLPVKDGKLPENCPGCNFLLRARREKAYNHNFVLAFRKAWIWCGRSTRRELLGFVTIMGSIGLLLALLMDIVCGGWLITFFREHIYPVATISGMLSYILIAIVGAALLLWLLAAFVPFISLVVRRLHDVGRGICWLIMLILFLAVSAGALYCSEAAAQQQPGTENFLSCVPVEVWPYAIIIPAVFSVVLGLTIGMFCIMDSERGSNKYGPSAKYPLE